MKRVLTLCVFIVMVTAANAADFIWCYDTTTGKTIVTNSPPPGAICEGTGEFTRSAPVMEPAGSGSKSSSVPKRVLNQRSNKSTRVFKTKGNKFAIWYDPSKWTQQKPDGIKVTFNHKDGDLYAMVIAERISTKPDVLKETVLSKARESAPDTKVTLEENRVMNGKTILCMRLEAELQGIQFVYYGYFYTGKEGTIQVLTYTTQNLYHEYESEMIEFLNGFTINN